MGPQIVCGLLGWHESVSNVYFFVEDANGPAAAGINGQAVLLLHSGAPRTRWNQALI
jgi:hypothetical protein